MNAQPNQAEFAMALYATANETHQRKDWRQACHALATALKSEMLRTTAVTAPIAPAPAEPTQTAPKAPRKPAGAKTAQVYTMRAESLTAALRLLCRVVEKRNTMPILSQVLIEAGRDVLTMRTTNMDCEIFVHIDAPDCGTWKATCDAYQLLNLLRQAKGAVAIVGETDNPHERKSGKGGMEKVSNTRVILSGAVSATLNGLPPGDFLNMLKPETALQPVKVEQAAFRDALTFVKPAISSEATRYYLNGAFLCSRHIDGILGLDVVATDGNWLNRVHLDGEAPTNSQGGQRAGYIIPRDTVANMLAVPIAAAFDLAISPAFVQMVAGPVVVTSKLIDGSFPDYTRVIPRADDGKHVLTFDAKAVSDALAKVSAVSSEKSRSVLFSFDDGRIKMTCRNMEGATSSETLACDYGAEAPADMSFNVVSLREAIASLACERVKVTLYGPNNPARLESADDGDETRLCVVMPLRF